jgi:arylsulfatase A-like enzyme|eukprot:COSAG06_NODE_3880_length_4809_cov_2.363482_6_plen_113_part_00
MHGSDQIPTPNIDHLAATGQRLNKYYVNPVCSPTRASLMSGRSVIHHGVFTPYGGGDDASGLNLTYTLLPAHLKNAYNYATYMVGKVLRSPPSPPQQKSPASSQSGVCADQP